MVNREQDFSLDPKSENRVLRWNLEEQRLRRIKPPIEDGALASVVGLNLAGVKTYFSCEGHYPIRDSRGRKMRGSTGKWQRPWISFDNSKDILDWEREAAVSKQVEDLLSGFYRVRPSLSPKYQLYLEYKEINGYQISHFFFAGNMDEIDDVGLFKKEKDQKAKDALAAQQREIRDFGTYLKTRFLETGGIDK